MPARSKARKRALDLLFEAELRGEPVLELLEERQNARADDGPPVPDYAAGLVRGVQAHRERIDELLGEYAQGWTLDRMPAVDRNVLRIGAYELLWADGVPDGVAISEAVELTVSSTDPGLQGDRSTGGTKPAKLETGAEIAVPLFISTGEKIKVDTRTGSYLGRA